MPIQFDSAWGIWLQSHTLQAPLKQVESASALPAMDSAADSCGSLSEMLEWTFRVTLMPWDLAKSRNACGSGKRAGFHSQPSHWFGAFQSVSTERLME